MLVEGCKSAHDISCHRHLLSKSVSDTDRVGHYLGAGSKGDRRAAIERQSDIVGRIYGRGRSGDGEARCADRHGCSAEEIREANTLDVPGNAGIEERAECLLGAAWVGRARRGVLRRGAPGDHPHARRCWSRGGRCCGRDSRISLLRRATRSNRQIAQQTDQHF